MSNSSVFDLSYLSHEVENIDVSDRQFDKYVGHLKRENKCIALRQHHFLLAECDDKGNISKKDLFVQRPFQRHRKGSLSQIRQFLFLLVG